MSNTNRLPPLDLIYDNLGDFFPGQESNQALFTLAAQFRPTPPIGGPIDFPFLQGELNTRGYHGRARLYITLNGITGAVMVVKSFERPQPNVGPMATSDPVGREAIRFLWDIDHPNVLRHFGLQSTSSYFNIFSEYVPGKSLAVALKSHGKLEENITKSLTTQILRGLEYLHNKGIVHRDICSSNILVDPSGACKISDFRCAEEASSQGGVGTVQISGETFWTAPELVVTPSNPYDVKSDIWALGCILLEMWTGERPWFPHDDAAVMLHLAQQRQPTMVNTISLSREAEDLGLNYLFVINPRERASAGKLLNHPYLIMPLSWTFTGLTGSRT